MLFKKREWWNYLTPQLGLGGGGEKIETYVTELYKLDLAQSIKGMYIV